MDFNNLIALQNRKIFYSFLKEMPREDLVTLPAGFNNSILWNIAHVVVTQQRLVYGLSGLPMNVSDYWLDNYSKGTKPDGSDPGDDKVEELKDLLFSTIEKTQQDLEAGAFVNFKEYMTTPKVPLRTAPEALAFNTFHEGLHLGTILDMRRTLGIQ